MPLNGTLTLYHMVSVLFDQLLPICYNYNMKTLSFTVQLPRQRRRAVELYSRDTPFRPKVERPKTVYQRQPKHRNRDE